MTDPDAMLPRLEAVVRAMGPIAVAVSGGVDSMTLAVVAHRACPGRVRMAHAVSAAVPPQATERVRRHAAREGWVLRVLDAGEFGDPNYRANPSNRCFYCKTNLYGYIASVSDRPIVSGTNTRSFMADVYAVPKDEDPAFTKQYPTLGTDAGEKALTDWIEWTTAEYSDRHKLFGPSRTPASVQLYRSNDVMHAVIVTKDGNIISDILTPAQLRMFAAKEKERNVKRDQALPGPQQSTSELRLGAGIGQMRLGGTSAP